VDDPQLRDEALGALRALDRDGVFGVPFFVAGREHFWGLDRMAAFAALVRADRSADLPEQLAAEEPALVPGGDIGHAGGCG
jgi:hypothetical protein